jgi:hypothetical protein
LFKKIFVGFDLRRGERFRMENGLDQIEEEVEELEDKNEEVISAAIRAAEYAFDIKKYLGWFRS